MYRLLFFIIVSVILVNCSTVRLAENGIKPRLNSKDISTYSENSNKIIDAFILSAGIDNVKTFTDSNGNVGKTIVTSDQAYLVYRTGANYIESTCDEYLEALDQYSRALARVKGINTNAALATETTLALVEASTTAIGIVAAAFGFTSNTIDTLTSTLFAELDAAGIRRLVDEQFRVHNAQVRARYKGIEARDSVSALSADETFSNRAEVLIEIRQHLQICLPTGIKNAINQSINTAEVDEVTSTQGIVINKQDS